MKKLICLVLATVMLFGLIGCSGNSVPAQGIKYTVADTVGAGDADLSDFFGGKVKEKLGEYAPILFSFATALHHYPEVLSQTPDSNFGWSFLYTMLAGYDLRPTGVKSANGTIEATAEAIDNLQYDTLGGSLWIAPGQDFIGRVVYYPVEQRFTCTEMDAVEFTCEITAASFNAETGRADITVTLSDAGSVLETYIISMRTDEDSAYSYVIASFAAA